MTREKAYEILDRVPICKGCEGSDFPYTCEECEGAFLKAFEALKQPDWIPVGERLPEDMSDVLAYFDNGVESRIIACNYANGVWYDCVFDDVTVFKHITHWMPLPKRPDKGSEEE